MTRGRVTAILYSRLATSLRSLAIILPIHLHLLSLASTFATVSYNYHTYAYEAEHRRTCPYKAIAKDEIEIKHVAGTEMLADALTKPLGGVILGEFVEEIGLG